MSDEPTPAPAETPPATDEPAAPHADTLTAGMAVPYHTLGPYTTLQEGVARLGRTPVGLLLDDAGRPVTIVTRQTLVALLGGGKDSARAHGKMGARQQSREKREGTSASHTLITLRDDLPPLVSAPVGTPLAPVAAEVQTNGAAGVLLHDGDKRLGVVLAPALFRRAAHPTPPAEEPPPAPAPPPPPAPSEGAKAGRRTPKSKSK